MRTKGPPSSSGVLGGGANLSTALGPPALGRPVAWRQRNEAVSKTKKIVNMLADDTAAPAAARTLAKAAEQEGKLISDYLTERLQHDHAPPTSALGQNQGCCRRSSGKETSEGREVCADRTAAQLQGARGGHCDGSGVQGADRVP